ncbi:MAG: hypothetical protein CL666_01375 [Balneola sp.]|nr:hypothetical protein [Balneola sp.]|tara:strand:+ start:13492 stop:15144 length:1653 start_codon:yes stop_codon:yes gene_type:complete
MSLDKELLKSDELSYEYSDEFQDCLNAHGLYNSQRFVVRLSPVNHDSLDKITKEEFSELSEQDIQSYSTYLHETIHWWQHIGSTIGLIMSLSYPAQTHSNVVHLREYLKISGAKKSIDIYNKINATEFHPTDDEFHHINIILNNYFDIEYFRSLVTNPKTAKSVYDSGYFESVGHSYFTGYTYSIQVLAEVFDRRFNHFPKPDDWLDEIDKLKEKKVRGYYYGSEIVVPPLGLKEVLEGQARFSQLQFLHYAFGKKYDWMDFAKVGKLDGIYFKAFQIFLDITELDLPQSIHDPKVGLFLLVCDLAINPGEGFPFNLEDCDSFITSVDPGFRFTNICLAIKKSPELGEMIVEYSKKEYESVSGILCKAIDTYTPNETCSKVLEWIKNSEELQALLKEEENFTYQNINQPIRVILAKFLRYTQDKVEFPEFFCWPGYWKVGDKTTENHQNIWMRHLSLFMDRKGDKGIYPREFPNAIKENIHKTFNAFYAWNIMYDLTRQWIIGEGDFKYDYTWLTEKKKETELKESADKVFENIYGEFPDNFEILMKTKS